MKHVRMLKTTTKRGPLPFTADYWNQRKNKYKKNKSEIIFYILGTIFWHPSPLVYLTRFLGQKMRRVLFPSFIDYFKIYNSSKRLDVPIASQSFACKARTAGTLSLTEVEAASSDNACSRRTEAAIEPAPSAAVRNRQWSINYTCLQPKGISRNSWYSWLTIFHTRFVWRLIFHKHQSKEGF